MEGDVGCGSRVYPLAKAAVLVMPYYLASSNTAGRPGQRRSLARPCRPAQGPNRCSAGGSARCHAARTGLAACRGAAHPAEA